MAVKDLWVGIQNSRTSSSETEDEVLLIVNQEGIDVVYEAIDAPQLKERDNGVARKVPKVPASTLEWGRLGPSSYRLETRGDDMWLPQIAAVWAKFDRGKYGLLATNQTNLPMRLSHESSEGWPSTPLQRCVYDKKSFETSHVLMIVVTKDTAAAETSSQVQLLLEKQGERSEVLVSSDRDGPEPTAFRRGSANLFARGHTLTKKKLMNDGWKITLRHLGSEPWEPESLFVFAFEGERTDKQGRRLAPRTVPLVALETWELGPVKGSGPPPDPTDPYSHDPGTPLPFAS